MEIQKTSLVGGIQRASHSNHPTTQNIGQAIATKMSVVYILVLHITGDTKLSSKEMRCVLEEFLKNCEGDYIINNA